MHTLLVGIVTCQSSAESSTTQEHSTSFPNNQGTFEDEDSEKESEICAGVIVNCISKHFLVTSTALVLCACEANIQSEHHTIKKTHIHSFLT
jgi:hypothetical protein